jgi:hypothetical protein
MGFAISTYQNHVITVWRQPATLEALRELREVERRLLRINPKGVSGITVMEPSSFDRMMGAAEREEASSMAKEFNDRTLAGTYIFEGEGFRAAMARAVVSGILLVSRARYPHKVFPSVEDGLSWLGSKLGTPFDGAELALRIAETRAKIR